MRICSYAMFMEIMIRAYVGWIKFVREDDEFMTFPPFLCFSRGIRVFRVSYALKMNEIDSFFNNLIYH